MDINETCEILRKQIFVGEKQGEKERIFGGFNPLKSFLHGVLLLLTRSTAHNRQESFLHDHNRIRTATTTITTTPTALVVIHPKAHH